MTVLDKLPKKVEDLSSLLGLLINASVSDIRQKFVGLNIDMMV